MIVNNMVSAATDYLTRGWSVIPLKPRDKRPLAAWKAFQEQYARMEQVEVWFDGTDNNLGIVSGKLSNLTIVDCDSQEAIEFFESRDYVPTLQVTTAHGRHYYYQYVEGSSNFQAKKEWPGIDLRSEGGYVVAPGSTHPSGAVYSWANDLLVAKAPAWLFERPPQNAQDAQERDFSPSPDVGDIFAPCAVGGRNMALTRAAGKLLANLPFGEALQLCQMWNRTNPVPLPDDELRRTVQSVAQKEKKKTAPKDIIRSFEDLRESLQTLRRTGIPMGVSTGIRGLDDYYRVPLGQWTLITGTPSAGKSSFLSHLLVNLMENEGWKFVLFSAENLPIEHFAARLIACYLKKPFHQGTHTRLTAEEVDYGLSFLSDHCKYIDASEETLSVEEIVGALRGKKEEWDFQGAVLDPWNEMAHSTPAGKLETTVTSDELGLIRRFARSANVHIWVVAHPRLMHRNRDGEYNIVTPYDVSGSAHFRNKADFCLTLHRNFEESRDTEVHVQKVRFSENGKIGMVRLGFDTVTGRYYDVE